MTPDGRKNKIGLQKVARMDTVRVVVADDNIQLRDMVAEYLQEQNGIEVVGTKILPDSVGNAMASVAAASYTVRFREGREPNIDIEKVLPAFLAKDSILITKATKKGSRELDLRPGIYEMNWDGNAFSMLVNASSAGNIKPIQIIEALLAEHGETLQENALLVTREDMYTDISPEEEVHQFVSLGDIGDDKEYGGTDEP